MKGNSTSESVELESLPRSGIHDVEAGTIKRDSHAALTDEAHLNDQFCVDFTPDDPENPKNWPAGRKHRTTAVLCITVMCATMSSSLIAPAIPTIQFIFHCNREVATLTLSLVVLGWATGPLIFSPMSEIYGRTPVYRITWVCFVLFNLACALSKNIATLVICRLFSGVFGGVVIALAPASAYDMYSVDDVGPPGYFIALVAFLGTVLGPMFGGYMLQYKNWRWPMWMSAIYSLVMVVPFFVLVPETNKNTILSKKAERKRQETGISSYYSPFDRHALPKFEIFKTAIWRPLQLLAMEPIILLTSLMVSMVWGILYLYMGAYLYVFEGIYGWQSGNTGAAFGGIGVGILMSLLVAGPSNKLYIRLREKHGNGKPYPEGRLPPAMVAGCLVPISIFWFAWTGNKKIHWIVPILSGVPFGFAMTILFLAFVGYTADGFPTITASASAANYFLRALFSFAFPLFTSKFFKSLESKWAETILGCISLLFVPLPFLLYRYGPYIRSKSRWTPKYV